ncbi:hypothetical protein [Vitiosangium sp. GDMCC 1.1324]|uniref:hypothetical protein n=1 Tax=Vitiosangium sp. (strain GDMCC 1.1324) TaxID=2138576 RepID=UPI000D38E805|nr:hypothetical protein [Vitiosangium sp. GDMCC 1.1324]PTL81525.1 hypothetical protein DAT35_21400 [Vitiosangium sp. GDMCC 1.1324]
MRRALLIAVGVIVSLLACRTTQPPGAESAQPIQPATDTEPHQLVPAEPPGPSTPLTEPDAGTPSSNP